MTVFPLVYSEEDVFGEKGNCNWDAFRQKLQKHGLGFMKIVKQSDSVTLVQKTTVISEEIIGGRPGDHWVHSAFAAITANAECTLP